MQLADLLGIWNRLEPRNCFPLRASKRKLYVVKLDEKSHSTIDPVNPKAEDFAKLQRALQYAIADRGWMLCLSHWVQHNTHAINIRQSGQEWIPIPGAKEILDPEAAIAIIQAYTGILEHQAIIEVEAAASPSLLVEGRP